MIKGDRNQLSEKHVSSNSGDGFYVIGKANRLEDNEAISNGEDGFDLGGGTQTSGCTAIDNVDIGFRVAARKWGRVSASMAVHNFGNGFEVSRVVLEDVTAVENRGDGIVARNGGVIKNANARANEGNGIRVSCCYRNGRPPVVSPSFPYTSRH